MPPPSPQCQTADPDPYSFAALHGHYRACRRRKRSTHNALAFEVDAEANLLALQDDLRSRNYRPGPSICFVTDGPKPREVFAADFRDRIVHHLLVAHQEPVFERRFIHDSYACRRSKGTLAASDRLITFLRQATANGRRPAWALQLDVRSFFASIRKETLWAILESSVPSPELRWLTHAVLFHDPTSDYHFKGRPGVHRPWSPRYPVAPEKSLFGKNNERGLPIGNLTSQFWANVYLDQLDQFVKRELRRRWYLRYVDDMILLSHDAAELLAWRERMARFLDSRLGLRLKDPRAEPIAAGRGVDFVGWKTWHSHRVPRRRTLANLDMRLRAFDRAATEPWGCRPPIVRVALAGERAEARVAKLQATLASYSGHLRNGAAARPWRAMWRRYAWLEALFDRRGWRAIPRFPPLRLRRAPTFRAQYRILLAGAGELLVFVRVGRYLEFYGPQRLLAQSVLGLRPVPPGRAGYGLAAGFPVPLLRTMVARAASRGIAVAVIDEDRRAPLRSHVPRLAAALFAQTRLCAGAGHD